ncbi:MAG: hypothetical protein WC315_00905 [Candidatus Omnitrophota bacterium]|jgi:hypothetical protein
MPSTDIDGSPIIILSQQEATIVYNLLLFVDKNDCSDHLYPEEDELKRKIERFLNECH